MFLHIKNYAFCQKKIFLTKLIEWLTVMKKFHTRFVIQYRYLLSLYKDYMIYNVPLP